jgi:hypothetical protein
MVIRLANTGYQMVFINVWLLNSHSARPIYIYTVYIRKPDRPSFEWSSLGQFLGPSFECKKQDGRFSLDLCIYLYTYTYIVKRSNH